MFDEHQHIAAPVIFPKINQQFGIVISESNDMDHLRRTPQSQTTTAATQPETPTWLDELHNTVGNSGLLHLVTGTSVDEETAAALLDGTGMETSTDQHSTAERWDVAMADTVRESSQAPAPPQGRLAPVHAAHQQRMADGLATTLDSSMTMEVETFRQLWAQNRSRYEAVAAETDVPAPLIAAIHYRESSGDFGRYLHQGDPLGRPAVRVPTNIPVFHEWHPAAVHAINMKGYIRDSLDLNAKTRDPVAMATFAEAYNGLGYHNRGSASPYVYSGTDVYTGGKYVRDGVYSATAKDQQPGVMLMMGAVGELDGITLEPLTPQRAWQRVLSGEQLLRQNTDHMAVEYLQQLLQAAGEDVSVDGDFGPGTHRAVLAFQRAQGLTADGIVGASTALALQETAQAPSR